MANTLSNLVKPAGASKKKTRVGRGPGSGLGKTSGRGQKGQYARSRGFKPHFEGGQTPLHRRLPKRGFKNPFSSTVVEVNVGLLERFDSGTKVNETLLRDLGMIKGVCDKVKILGNGELTKKLFVEAEAFSKSAVEKIEKAGGSVVIIGAVEAN